MRIFLTLAVCGAVAAPGAALAQAAPGNAERAPAAPSFTHALAGTPNKAAGKASGAATRAPEAPSAGKDKGPRLEVAQMSVFSAGDAAASAVAEPATAPALIAASDRKAPAEP